MRRKIINALVATALYFLVANGGNLFFGVDRAFSWTTTLWEALFFFLFILLLQNYRKKKH